MPDISSRLTLFVYDCAQGPDGVSGLFPGVVSQLSLLQRERSGAAPRRLPILVNNPQISDRLRLNLARTNGICMGFEFLSPGDFFGRTLRGNSGENRLREACCTWSPAALRWRLLPRVENVARQLGFDPAAATAIAPRELFATAELLAQQLDRTLRQRPTWATAWKQGRNVLPEEFAATEEWQRSLWSVIANETGMPPHPAEILAEIASRSVASDSELSGALVYIATDVIDPFTLEALNVLTSGGWSVQVHALLPSLGYMGDLPSRSAKRARWNDAAEDIPAGHPLLISLGQQAIGTFLQLGTVDADYAAWPLQPEDDCPENASLLTRLQHDVRSQRPPDPSLRPALADDDDSLKVHSCHSPRRELEVLRDEILRAFQDERLPRLRPEDIVVGLTDFDTYAPLAEAILRRPSAGLPQGLPVRLTSVSGREANAVMVALLAILRMAAGRKSASELLDLLTLESVQARLGIADDPDGVEQLSRWLRDSGLTHGLDLGDGEPIPGGWRGALDRLLAGFWMGPAEDIPCPQDNGHIRWVHPMASSLAENDNRLLEFCAWLSDLRDQLITCTGPASAVNWAERLRRLVRDSLHSRSFDEESQQCQSVIGELALVPVETKLNAGAVIDWLAPHLANATSLRTSLNGKILVGRLEQVRSLPCRVLAIAGLEHGRFPRTGACPAWDLVSLKPERWDPETRRRDRQLFLDAILTPSDKLILTASNRNRITGKNGPFSACVDDLLRAAAITVNPPNGSNRSLEQCLVVHHSLQPFAADYFLPESKLPNSFDAEAAATAAAIAKGPSGGSNALPFARSGAPGCAAAAAFTTDLKIGISELIAFWKDPAKAWLKALRAAAPWAEQDERDLDDPPIELDGLDHFDVTTVQLEEALRIRSVGSDVVLSRLVAERRMPPGFLGKLRWDLLQGEIRPFLDLLVPVHRQSRMQPFEVTFDVADSRLGDLRRVTLAGQIRILAGQDGDPPRVLVYRPGKFDKEKYQLEAWIQMLVAASAPGNRQGAGGVAYGTGSDPIRELHLVAPDEARQHLIHLLVGFCVGQLELIAYAPETSGAIAQVGAEAIPKQALEKAASVWMRRPSPWAGGSPGEGTLPSALLAWRGQDPFADSAGAAWLAWANTVAKPLHDWWSPPQSSPNPAANDSGAGKRKSGAATKKR